MRVEIDEVSAVPTDGPLLSTPPKAALVKQNINARIGVGRPFGARKKDCLVSWLFPCRQQQRG